MHKQDGKPGHNIMKDAMIGNSGLNAKDDADKITESTLLVVEVLNGIFTHLQNGTTFDLSGMNGDQKKEFMGALQKGNFGL